MRNPEDICFNILNRSTRERSMSTTFVFVDKLHNRPPGQALHVERKKGYTPDPQDSKLLVLIIKALLQDGKHAQAVCSDNPYTLVIQHSPAAPWSIFMRQIVDALRKQQLQARFLGYSKETFGERLTRIIIRTFIRIRRTHNSRAAAMLSSARI